MRNLFIIWLFFSVTSVCAQADKDSTLTKSSNLTQSLPERNQQVLNTVIKNGRKISPTYEDAVCTELVIGVLAYFLELSNEDKINIRIDQPRESIEDVYQAMEEGKPEPKGVVHALVANGKGVAVEKWEDVLPGDFVQFWYPHSWGHCGIVDSIDLEHRKMYLHSSFPTTNGYGVQEFKMPDYCYFVRLL